MNYHIETNDGSGCFNFFTKAKTNKKALMKLLKRSHDFRSIVKPDKDLIIKVKLIK